MFAIILVFWNILNKNLLSNKQVQGFLSFLKASCLIEWLVLFILGILFFHMLFFSLHQKLLLFLAVLPHIFLHGAHCLFSLEVIYYINFNN